MPLVARQFLCPVLFAVVTLSSAILINSAWADQTDKRLDTLFDTLQKTIDPEIQKETEQRIWGIWYDSGDTQVDELMTEAAYAMRYGELAKAESVYTEIVSLAPEFSEGWNRRATVRYHLGNHDQALEDIQQTLSLEPRHFGALWGLGMILGARGNYVDAIKAFEILLEVKPNTVDAAPRIEFWKQQLKKQSL